MAKALEASCYPDCHRRPGAPVASGGKGCCCMPVGAAAQKCVMSWWVRQKRLPFMHLLAHCFLPRLLTAWQRPWSVKEL